MAIPNSTRPAPCAWCGGDVPPRPGSGRRPIYCSPECRAEWRRDYAHGRYRPHPRARTPRVRPTYRCACGAPRSYQATQCVPCYKRTRARHQTCEHCGTPFSKRKDHGRDQRFCSYTCRGAWTRARTAERHAQQRQARPGERVARLKARPCSQCGASVGHSSAGKWCSDACLKKQWRQYKEAKAGARPQRTCKECRDVFIAAYGNTATVFCGVHCSKRYGRRIGKAARKARLRGVPCERIDPIAVFERDGWRCQLCGCSTPKRLRGQMVDRAPELDHIIPLGGGHGGTHTWTNVQCACRKCNIAKSDKPLGQLRLS